MSEIFKAYDIRGIYGETITDDIVRRIGRAFVSFLKCKKVVVGRDMRSHSENMFKALAGGLTQQGADVVDLGMCSTPMSNYANGFLQADAAIMITASHNPAEYNGLKLSREKCIPIGGDSGMRDIQRMVEEDSCGGDAGKPGSVTGYDIFPEYKQHVLELADMKRPVKAVADAANAMGILEIDVIREVMSVEPMFAEFDGTFPNHEANPLKLETLASLQEKVKSGDYDFGISFDGDADRAGFVDEKGEIVPMDCMIALIARDMLEKEKGVVLYDLRSSWAVPEIIRENGGTPMISRVGHAFIKKQMRDNNAIFAGELSGHYYFRNNYYTESSSTAAICVANIISKSGKPLSELMKPIRRYHASGEINSKVSDIGAVLERIKEKYADARIMTLDGVTVEYDDWWFNVRPSNTEPLIRLNLEAKSRDKMEARRDEVLSEIRK
ncbi:MAG: phosphomannomutase/phosphoglucomutase [Kiritimatiellia bacterium]